MTKRRIKNQIDEFSDELAERPDGAATDLTVTWREAAPDERPEGLLYDSDAGELIYDLWTAQRDCLNALKREDTDLVAFLSGYGSGKSIFGARWLIAQALAHPGSRFLAMGIDFTKARDTTFRILFEQLPGTATAPPNDPETSPIVADYNQSAFRLTLTNGAVIRLASGADWQRCAGDEFGAIWLDEPSHYAADLHDLREMLGGRLRGVAGPKVMCWTLTGNGYNDAWEIIEQRQDKTGDPIGDELAMVRASTLENPYLDAGTIEQLKRQFEGTAREAQALEGGFDAPKGRVYADFEQATHVIEPSTAADVVDDNWRLYGYDAGWRDPRVLLEIGRTGAGQLVVLDEFYETECHVEDVIEWLETDAKPRGKLFADHNPSDIHELRRAGYHTRAAEKAIDPGIADVRRRLRADDDGRVGLLVSSQCEHLVREFFGYTEDEVGTTSAIDHCLDALRYAVHGVDEGRPIDSWDETSESSTRMPDISGKVD